MLHSIARFVTKRPWTTIFGVLAITVWFVTRIIDFGMSPPRVRLEIDPSVERLLPDTAEARVFYDRVRATFGNDETIPIALASDDLFSAEVLRRVKRLSQRLSDLDGVDRVLSLFTALDIRGSEEAIDIEPFVSEIPEGEAELARIRDRVLSNPVYAGNLVSHDGRTTIIVVYLRDMAESDFFGSGLDQQIRTAAYEEMGPHNTVWIAGSLHIKVATSSLLLSDLSRIIPIGVLMLALVAFVAFFSVRGVLIPLSCIGIANVWTFGTMAIFGFPINLVTTVVPALVQTVGFAYTIHVVSEYEDHLREPDAEDPDELGAAGFALRGLLVPLGLTGFTTAAGLLSLTVSPLPAVREFGVLAVCGVLSSVILAATLAPALLALRDAREPRRLWLHDLLDRMAARLAAFDLRHQKPIFVATAFVFVLSLVGMTQIRVSTDFVSNFPADHRIRRDFEAINTHLEGASGLSVVLEKEAVGAFKEPTNLRVVEEFQEWLSIQPEVGGTTSLADYVRLIHWGFRGNDPEAMVIPNSRRLVSQLLFFGGNEDLSRFVDRTYRSTRIQVRSQTLDSGGMKALLDRTEERLRSRLPEDMSGRVTGGVALLARTVDDISLGQARSLALALAIIFVVLAALFRSIRVGLLALIPNVLPVAFYFGLLGLTGVTLNATTALVACLALGIAVDDTIHYLVRYGALLRHGAHAEEAAAGALSIVGRPVTVTSIALVLGFLALTTAELKNQADFGLMTAVTLGFAWLTDVLVTPCVAVTAGNLLMGNGGRKPLT